MRFFGGDEYKQTHASRLLNTCEMKGWGGGVAEKSQNGIHPRDSGSSSASETCNVPAVMKRVIETQ